MARLKQRMTQTENIPLSLFELPRSYNESIISDLNFGSDKNVFGSHNELSWLLL